MIRIIVGNVGSGKTALAIREMQHNRAKRKTYTNIKTPMSNVVQIDPSMIIHQETVDYKKNKKTGELEPVTKSKLNTEFWKAIDEPINVIIDEAHSIINSRRSMSKINIIITDWLALIRRILGENSTGYGELIFITQLPRRLDSIARDMATNITHCVMHYRKQCNTCQSKWQENSEMPEIYHACPNCDSNDLRKYSHTIEVWQFANMSQYEMWESYGNETYYKHYYVTDIEKYFHLYSTLQWDNLFSDFY